MNIFFYSLFIICHLTGFQSLYLKEESLNILVSCSSQNFPGPATLPKVE